MRVLHTGKSGKIAGLASGQVGEVNANQKAIAIAIRGGLLVPIEGAGLSSERTPTANDLKSLTGALANRDARIAELVADLDATKKRNAELAAMLDAATRPTSTTSADEKSAEDKPARVSRRG